MDLKKDVWQKLMRKVSIFLARKKSRISASVDWYMMNTFEMACRKWVKDPEEDFLITDNDWTSNAN